MSAKTQHELHPDVETLSAFAEQAQGERERVEVLAHLAVCGRCRKIVAMVCEASTAVAVTPAGARRAAARPRLWWRGWGLALAPLAAVAASAVIAIYVHERDVERNAEVARVEQQRSTEKAPMPPQPPTQAAPPVTASPAPETMPRERPGGRKRAPVAEPDEKAAAPPGAMNEPDSSGERYAGSPAETPGTMADAPAPSAAAFAPSRPSPDEKKESEVALYDEERRMQAEEKATEEHRFAAKAKTTASEHDSDSGSAGGSEQVVVTDQQLETQAAPPASEGSLMGFRAGRSSAARAANRVHLPSGLAAISIAHERPRMLAIDNSGALFLSEDSGANWEPVTTQWTGRALLVRKREELGSAATTPPPEKSKVAGDITGSDAASESVKVFELLNDQGQLWWSTDGRIWTAK